MVEEQNKKDLKSFIITEEGIEEIKKLIRQRSSHKIIEILNNLERVKDAQYS